MTNGAVIPTVKTLSFGDGIRISFIRILHDKLLHRSTRLDLTLAGFQGHCSLVRFHAQLTLFSLTRDSQHQKHS
jgi:hypothetical protein